MTDAAITIDSVTRTFGDTTALDGMAFRVPEHSLTGLLGRNGAGKTTILSIIAGQDRPTSGRVEVLGRTPFEDASVLRHLSYVRDNQRYPDDYRLRHVLRIAPDFAPGWDAELAAELADALRIPATTKLKKLSRGQISAIAIILGLASRAPVTLLDEPYLGLDVTARGYFHEVLLRDIAEHPRTIVLSTHLVAESERLFDRVVIVDRGRVVVEEDSDAVHARAFTLSGSAEAVDALIRDRTVLRTQAVAALKAVTVEGRADADLTAEAERRGVRVAPASLQDLVAGYGDDRTATTMGAQS